MRATPPIGQRNWPVASIAKIDATGWVPVADQIVLLTSIETTPFFRTVRDHTIMGMFSAPQHGGNFGKVGWKQIGFDDSLNFRAPFGAYDKA